MKGISNLCDYFVICSGESSKQVEAIYSHVLNQSKDIGYAVYHHSNDTESRWALVDFFDVILHIFDKEARDFYNLESLWKTAKKSNSLKIKNYKISLKKY